MCVVCCAVVKRGSCFLTPMFYSVVSLLPSFSYRPSQTVKHDRKEDFCYFRLVAGCCFLWPAGGHRFGESIRKNQDVCRCTRGEEGSKQETHFCMRNYTLFSPLLFAHLILLSLTLLAPFEQKKSLLSCQPVKSVLVSVHHAVPFCAWIGVKGKCETGILLPSQCKMCVRLSSALFYFTTRLITSLSGMQIVAKGAYICLYT